MASLGLNELSIEKCQVVTFVTDKFEPNCQPFADDFFKSIFLNENFLYFDYVF